MDCCTKLLLLTTLVGLTLGLPPPNKQVKRESPIHQIVEVPQHQHFSDFPDDLPKLDTRALRDFEQPGLDFGHHSKTSSQKLTEDHNGVSKIRTMIKSTETLKKRPTGGRKGPKKGKKSNVDLLHHIGMTKLRSPAVNYHRKRLASQSRKTHNQKSSSDSKMFVIKLPPNPYYYAHHNLNGYDVMEPQPNAVNKVPVNFKTNGKPSRVYHWNIPVIKKMVARKAGSSGKSAILEDSDIFNIDKQATWNETDDDKSLYRKATFYGPKKQSKHTFRKYFAGNGKPHSFYVMEKSKQPSSVFRLMP